jgi:hypothetical protein
MAEANHTGCDEIIHQKVKYESASTRKTHIHNSQDKRIQRIRYLKARISLFLFLLDKALILM